LRRAIELNQGEPEFWAYFGWAQFNASQDRAGRQEAFDAIARAKRESPDLAVIYEFIGRMARVEGDTSAAARNLKKALQLSPDNPDAERELRLLQMRKGSDDTGEQAGLMGALKGLFKKK
jgi:tetratricopeptide (TPR) repeat protein